MLMHLLTSAFTPSRRPDDLRESAASRVTPAALRSFAGLALAMALAVPAVSIAQQQPPASPLSPLGGGRALDANLSATQGRINSQVFDLQAMVRYNNAIVTGGATGGRSLRVPTGYTSDYGPFGSSSSVYRFNRDATDFRVSVLGASTASGLGQTGQRVPLGSGGSIGGGGRIDSSALQAAEFGIQRPSDTSVPRIGSLARSRASGNSGLIVGVNDDGRGGLGAVRASTLRGLVVEAFPDQLTGGQPPIDPLTGREVLTTPSTLSRPTGGPIDGRVQTRIDPATGNIAVPDQGSPRAGPAGSSPGATAPVLDPSDPRSGPTSLQPLRSNPSIEPFSRPGAGSAQLEQARNGFRSALIGATQAQRAREAAARVNANVPGSSSPSAQPGSQPGVQPEVTQPGAPANQPAPLTPQEIEATLERMRARLRGEYTPLGQQAAPSAPALLPALKLGPRSTSGAAGVVTPPRVILEELPERSAVEALREMNVRLKALVPDGATIDQSADGYIKFGQQLLTEGRYSSAEQAFEQAMLLRPGDTMARVGAAHAGIASGMLLSGSMDLRRVLADHPELIGVRFDPALLMPKARAAQLFEDIQKQHEVFPGGDVSRGGALIQAYLGRQFDEPAWLSRGLEVMAQTWTQGPALELRRVIEGAWGTSP